MNKESKEILTAAIVSLVLLHTVTAGNSPICATTETSATLHSTSGFPYTDALSIWKAGTVVTPAEIEKYSIEKCFVSTKIDERIQRRIQGKSYKKGCTIPLTDLRYLKVLHYTRDGEIRLGEMICHKDISDDLIDIFRTLYTARYPIERMMLVDEYGADDERSMTANNTTCFNYRTVANSRTLSNHSKGRAIDINPLYNPHVKRLRNGTTRTSPAAGKPYADRTRTFDYKIDTQDLCYKEFTRHGFRWGGHWKHSKDYQHFEKP